MWLLLIAIPLLAGLWMLWLGLRGRRVDDHPLCRRCGYDLVGTAPLPAQCAECGSPLDRPGAVRLGHRRRRCGMLAFAAFFLVFSIGPGIVLTYTAVQGFDWYPYKPFWLLRREVASADPAKATASQSEILRRLNDGELSDGHIKTLVAEGLAIQADPAKAWAPFWGDVIETAWMQKKAGDPQLAQYARTAVESSISLRTRTRLRAGSRVWYHVDRGPQRAANGSGLRVVLDHAGPTFPGQPKPDRQRRSIGGLHGSGRASSGSMFEANVPPGTYVLNFEARCTVLKPGVNMNPLSDEDIESHRLTEWPLCLQIAVEVVDADTPIVTEAPNPALLDDLRRCITIEKITLAGSSRVWRGQAQVHIDRPPVDVGFEIVWRVGQREWLMGGIAQRAGESWVRAGRPTRVLHLEAMRDFPLDVETVDVILRSSPRMAEEVMEIEAIWQGEIVFANQPLERLVPGGS